MPTDITAQNGAVINQTTNIAVTGCGGVLSSKVKLTKAQLLAKALKACKKKYKAQDTSKRVACEKQARKTLRRPKRQKSRQEGSHTKPRRQTGHHA